MRFEDLEKQKKKSPVTLALFYTFLYLLAAIILVYLSFRYNWFGGWAS